MKTLKAKSKIAIIGVSTRIFSFIYCVHTHSHNNTDNVPSAKNHIIIAHCKNHPLCNTIICILWVNQQGIKNVKAQTNHAYWGFLILEVYLIIFEGKCIHSLEILGTKPSNCKPKYNKIMPTIVFNIMLNNAVAFNVPQTSPNKPHPIKKAIILHKWNKRWVLRGFLSMILFE